MTQVIYLGIMVKSKKESNSAQGADSHEVPTVEAIEQWLSRDMMSARILIDAILTDKELRLHVATFMQGRYSNKIHRSDESTIPQA